MPVILVASNRFQLMEELEPPDANSQHKNIYGNMCMSLDEAGQDNEDDAIDMVVESPIS
jgi:hypothetical protein